MAMTPEKKVKQTVVKILKGIGAYYFFPTTGGYGRSGVPDIVGCYKGKFFGIECKAGKNTTTALQKIELEKIKKSGGIAMVLNEVNLGLVVEALNPHLHLDYDEGFRRDYT
jgi:Holliday junction resolvase